MDISRVEQVTEGAPREEENDNIDQSKASNLDAIAGKCNLCGGDGHSDMGCPSIEGQMRNEICNRRGGRGH